MSSRTTTPPPLPDELMESMHRIASITGSASAPWPAVDQTIKRQHRRRVALASASLAVVLAAGVGTASMLVTPAKPQRSPASQSMATDAHLAPELRKAGYTGAIGGSLASDDAFIAGLRTQVAALGKAGNAPDNIDHAVAADVLVFWAGDSGGRRIAIVGYQPGDATTPTLAVRAMAGAPGASPEGMTFLTTYASPISGADLGKPLRLLVEPDTGSHESSMVFVVAPGAHQVDVAVGRRFLANGTATTLWRPAARQGSTVWVGSLTPSERYLDAYQVNGAPMGIGPDETPAAPWFDLESSLQAVATPATEQGALRSIASALLGLKPSPDEVPILARTERLAGDQTLTAAVLRSPDNGYLVGLTLERPRPQGTGPSRIVASTQVTATTPGELLSAFQLEYSSSTKGAAFAVVAPAGATSVRSGSVTAPVVGRLAVIYLDSPQPPDPGVPAEFVKKMTIQALDGDGQVIGSTQSVSGYQFISKS